jgi:Zn-dependent protease with chaperone function
VQLSGRYFPPGASRYHQANARADANSGTEDVLTIFSEDDTKLSAAPIGIVEVSSRLGNLPRRFTFPSGALFECDDNDAAENLLAHFGEGERGGILHRLERSWRLALGAVVFTVISGIGFIYFGVPLTASFLANRTPLSVDQFIGEETLQTLDAAFFVPTELSEADQARAQILFARIARQSVRGEDSYRLLLRGSPIIGPNALALPDGTIILTDELWELREHDDEVVGVFAHETAHVDRRHSLQSVYRAAIVPAAIALVTGDPTQIAQMATILPGILVQAAYTRSLEQEADDDAVILLDRIGVAPSRMADLLERLDRELCGGEECGPSWIGTHPETAMRAARLRRER